MFRLLLLMFLLVASQVQAETRNYAEKNLLWDSDIPPYSRCPDNSPAGHPQHEALPLYVSTFTFPFGYLDDIRDSIDNWNKVIGTDIEIIQRYDEGAQWVWDYYKQGGSSLEVLFEKLHWHVQTDGLNNLMWHGYLSSDETLLARSSIIVPTESCESDTAVEIYVNGFPNGNSPFYNNMLTDGDVYRHREFWQAVPIQHILTHEYGHLLGMQHYQNYGEEASIMHANATMGGPTYIGNGSYETRPLAPDVRYLRSVKSYNKNGDFPDLALGGFLPPMKKVLNTNFISYSQLTDIFEDAAITKWADQDTFRKGRFMGYLPLVVNNLGNMSKSGKIMIYGWGRLLARIEAQKFIGERQYLYSIPITAPNTTGWSNLEIKLEPYSFDHSGWDRNHNNQYFFIPRSYRLIN